MLLNDVEDVLDFIHGLHLKKREREREREKERKKKRKGVLVWLLLSMM